MIEILLKVALNTINQIKSKLLLYIFMIAYKTLLGKAIHVHTNIN